MSVRIINADVMEGLRQLSDESVQCVVTSPPYWGLRDYGVPGQLGLEPTLGEHIDAMVQVFREVRRVLRKDGTLWLNYGDTYASSVNGRSAADVKALTDDDRTFRDKPFSTVGPVYRDDAGQVPDNKNPKARDRRGNTPCKQHRNEGSNHAGRVCAGGLIKPKDLCGVPWRLALALQADGWWLRQDIIWSKPNPMPESIKDRCTKAHEYLFLLAKSERYHFDAEAIAEPLTVSSIERISQNLVDQEGSSRAHAGAKTNGKMKAVYKRAKDHNEASRNPNSRPHNLSEFEAKNGREYPTRNKRSVWTVATQPFAEAHFATFPPDLIEPCIKAGCPPGGTVLDPFGGSGTTGLVADRLGRDAILIELNPEYAAMAERRISGDAPMFTSVTQDTLPLSNEKGAA